MTVKEFENNKEKAIESIELITNYIPYIQKVSECKNIVNITSHKKIDGNEILISDSTTRHLFYTMKLVQLYTNIEFEDMEMVEAFDILNKNGILNLLLSGQNSIIPEAELIEFQAIMDMVIDDIYENEYSTNSVLRGIKETIGIIVNNLSNMTNDVISDIENGNR